MSPMLDRLQSGGLPAPHAPSSHSVPVIAAAFWSVPGRSDLRTLLVATSIAVDESVGSARGGSRSRDPAGRPLPASSSA